jgi:hypothetical protein
MFNTSYLLLFQLWKGASETGAPAETGVSLVFTTSGTQRDLTPTVYSKVYRNSSPQESLSLK